MHYRSEIDGLRALAVIPVILFHAGFKEFGGGFVGVDVFFVISGYLITTILLSELATGNLSIIQFYERRARRILPALFFVMLICLPFAYLWLLPPDLKNFARSLVDVCAFIANFFFMRTTDYFDAATELKPLIHTWSLAVEEQFYLVFPTLLLLLWQRCRKWLMHLLILCAALSFALAEWNAYRQPSFAFFMLPTRAWELLVGAILALYYLNRNIKHHSHWTAEIGSIIGVCLICYAILAYSDKTPFPSFYTLAPVVGAGLIIAFANAHTLSGKILGSKPFVYIGLISYSAYLWHQPLLAFARQRSLEPPSQTLLGLVALCSIPLAYLTWRFVERPFRNRHVFSRKKVFLGAAVGSLFFITIGLYGNETKGYLNRSTEYIESFEALRKAVSVNHGLSDDCETDFTYSKNCRNSDAPEIIVWGDSYAMHLVDGILASKPNAKIIQTTISSCGPFFDVAPFAPPNEGTLWGAHCIQANDRVKSLLTTEKSIRFAVISSPFTGYTGKNSKLLTREGEIVSGETTALTYFKKTLNTIRSLGVTPIVFSPPPKNGNDIGGCLLKAWQHEEPSSKCNFALEDSEALYAPTNHLLQEIEVFNKVIWLKDGMCRNGICYTYTGDVFIYRDSGHLSHQGSAHIGKSMNFYELITQNSSLTPATQQ